MRGHETDLFQDCALAGRRKTAALAAYTQTPTPSKRGPHPCPHGPTCHPGVALVHRSNALAGQDLSHDMAGRKGPSVGPKEVQLSVALHVGGRRKVVRQDSGQREACGSSGGGESSVRASGGQSRLRHGRKASARVGGATTRHIETGRREEPAWHACKREGRAAGGGGGGGGSAAT